MSTKTGNNKRLALAYRRIVVKLGTSLLTGGGEHLDPDVMKMLVSQAARLHQAMES